MQSISFQEDSKDSQSSNTPISSSNNLKRGLRALIRRYFRQTRLLTIKNLKLSFRNSSATLAQLCIGVLFLFVLLIIQDVIRATARNDPTFIQSQTHLDRAHVGPYPSCTVGKGLEACYNFAYASTRQPPYVNYTAVENLVDMIAVKLNISPSRNVNGGILELDRNFSTIDIDNWMLENQNVTKVVILFENSYQWRISTSTFRYIFVHNSTKNCAELGIYNCNDPWLDYHIPLISATNAAFISLYGGDPSTQINVSFSNFPHPDLPAAFDAMRTFGTLFVYIAFTFNYVVLLSMIVREKELHLVESMRQMGMMNSAYWTSWFISATITNTIMVLLLMLFGVILRFDLFVKTDPGLLITILWLSAEAFTSMAFFFSAFIRTTASARVIGVMVFILTFLTAPLLYLAYFTDGSELFNKNRVIVSIFPFFSFYTALQRVIDNSSGVLRFGTKWTQQTDNILPDNPYNRGPTFWSIQSSMLWMIASFFIFFSLAWYFEQVIPNEYGRSKHPLFVFRPSYWFGKRFCRYGIRCKRKKPELGVDGDADAGRKLSRLHRFFCGYSISCSRFDAGTELSSPVFDEHTDEDVKQEATRIYENTMYPQPAVVVHGVTKVFGKKKKKFTAVDAVFYGMHYGQLTAILGHNGSGKSTTFNMLTGLSSVTGGTAKIFGRSVSEDMSELHAAMGVCPQHDVLWERLTAREHLELFANLKGFDSNVATEANKRLNQVKLVSAADGRVGGFSGGMKRRLSIAIAMIGDPSIVFLDEPTTGMDPVTRREVLEMISESKTHDRVIVLTSHAMEEVEMLADKVVVMSRGKIQAVGTVTRLKKRFGLGYKMTMFGTTLEQVQGYMKQFTPVLGDTKIDRDRYGAIFVGLPNAQPADLVSFFSRFETEKSQLGVEDYSLSLSTLEEVFLNLSHSEEERENEKKFRDPQYKKRFDECAAYQPKPNLMKVSMYAQANALFWKSLTFQRKNLSTCLCTVLFPIIIMVGLIVLNNLVFEPLKLLAVCGYDVDKNPVNASACPQLGPDVGCIASLNEFRTTSQIDRIIVGAIDSGGRVPANKNCNQNVCFHDLEKLDAGNFPTSSAGDNIGTIQYNYGNSSNLTLFEWYADLVFILDTKDTSICDIGAYYRLNPDIYCFNKSSPAIEESCRQNTSELSKAVTYLQLLDKNGPRYANSLEACYRPDAILFEQITPSPTYISQARELQVQYSGCKLQEAVTSVLPQFGKFGLAVAIQETKKNGTGFMKSFSIRGYLEPALREFNEVVWDALKALLGAPTNIFASSLQAGIDSIFVTIGIDKSDSEYLPSFPQLCSSANLDQLEQLRQLLEQFNITDFDVNSLNFAEVFNAALQQLNNSQSLLNSVLNQTLNNNLELFQQLTVNNISLAEVFTQILLGQIFNLNPQIPTFDNVTNAELLTLFQNTTVIIPLGNGQFITIPLGTIFELYPIQMALLSFLGGQLDSLINLCDVFSNLDVVRGTSSKDFGEDRKKMDLDIYSSWFGRRVQTRIMREARNRLKGNDAYKLRQYYSRFGGFFVKNYSSSLLDLVIYHNKTAARNDIHGNWMELVQMTESTYLRDQTDHDVSFRVRQMPVRFRCNRDEWLADMSTVKLQCDILPRWLTISVIDYVALNLFPFLFFTFAFLVVNQIVYEKEKRLRVIMKMNGGLKNSAYWGVAFFLFYIQFLIMSVLIFILGNLANLKFTSLHDGIVYWSFVITWGAVLTVFAFIISIFFASSESSTAGTFLIILIFNLIGIQLMTNLVQDPNSIEASYSAMMWLPPFVMIRLIVWIGLAGVIDEKITVANFNTFGGGALINCLTYLWIEFVVCVILLWYLDNVYVAGFGTRKSPLFFLNCKYWKGEKQGNDKKSLEDYQIDQEVLKTMVSINNQDVVDEHNRVINEDTENLVVRVVRLHKKFENGNVALKSLSLGINESECFGLLGHNGAGKTTAISTLVGLFEPTSGTASVDGLSINHDMDSVQTRMGVCPQHDICWGPLSVRDHLLFYARLKGIPTSEISLAVDKALFDVNLKQFETRPADKLSGGMRRRLSTAMSLIGTPRVVYLDEPSTGLDPASKRALWNVIEKAKGSKSLVLTTHSMEEAEVLCDRIGIMALGELQCIGTAAQLKHRFGEGYTFFLATKNTKEENVLRLVDQLFGIGNSHLLGKQIGGTFKFEIKRKAVILSQVFALMESETIKIEYSVLDWSLTETTLEEVFLKLADLANVDEALSKDERINPKNQTNWCLLSLKVFTMCIEKIKKGSSTKWKKKENESELKGTPSEVVVAEAV